MKSLVLILSFVIGLNFCRAFLIEDHQKLARDSIFKTAAGIFHLPSDDYDNAADLFAAAFGPIPVGIDLTSAVVYTTKPFEKTLAEIESYLYELPSIITEPSFFWNQQNIQPSIDKLYQAYDSFYTQMIGFNLEYMRRDLAKMIFMIQGFYARSNWIENGNTKVGLFLLDVTEPVPADLRGENTNGKDLTTNPNHELAKSLASQTVRQLFDGLREAIGLRNFKILLGIEGGKTIAFNIDDTGSMSSMISSAKSHAIQIGNAYALSKNPPQKYILQSFNDPTIGDLEISSDVHVIEAKINELKANGGGDSPELCFTGLIQVLNNLEENSFAEIFVYTDANAKDVWLLEELVELILKKKPRISFLINFIPIDLPSSPYRHVSDISGGEILKVDSTSIMSTVDFLVSKASSSSEILHEVLKVKDTRTLSFSVDQSVYETRLTIVGSEYELNVYGPDGLEITPELTTNIGEVKIYSVRKPTKGLWSLKISAKNEVKKVKIEAITPVSVNVKLVPEIRTFSIGGIEIKDSLINSSRVGALIDLFGASSSSAPSIEQMEIYDQYGNLFNRVSLVKKSEFKFFAKSFRIPGFDFRIKLTGQDESKLKYERMDPRTFRVSSLIGKAVLKSIKDGYYSIEYEINNYGSKTRQLAMKVEVCDDFSVDSFYLDRKFYVNQLDYFSDVVLLKNVSKNSKLCTVKLIFKDSETGDSVMTKIIDMNYFRF